MEDECENENLKVSTMNVNQDNEYHSDNDSEINITIEASISEAGKATIESDKRATLSLNLTISQKHRGKHRDGESDDLLDTLKLNGEGKHSGPANGYSDINLQFKSKEMDQFREMINKRSQLGCRSIEDLGLTQLYNKVDEVAEGEEMKAGYMDVKGLYRDRKFRPNKYTMHNKESGNGEDLSLKITKEARVCIDEIHILMKKLFETLSDAMNMILEKDFKVCAAALDIISKIEKKVEQLIEKLRWSPYEHELLDIKIRLQALIEELEVEPPFVLLRLVEFGYYMYEMSKLLREEFIPSSFVTLVHSIQSRLYRMNTGRVIRQIYYVPPDLDPIVGTYFKSRRMLRIENFCRCKIVLLSPEDPRASCCPFNFRTIEVNFDPQRGRYLGFAHLLNQCSPSKIHTVKLAATIYRRISGIENQLWPEEMIGMERNEARSMYTAIQSDIAGGTGQAIAPKINAI